MITCTPHLPDTNTPTECGYYLWRYLQEPKKPPYSWHLARIKVSEKLKKELGWKVFLYDEISGIPLHKEICTVDCKACLWRDTEWVKFSDKEAVSVWLGDYLKIERNHFKVAKAQFNNGWQEQIMLVPPDGQSYNTSLHKFEAGQHSLV